jgi:hypothetical protein
MRSPPTRTLIGTDPGGTQAWTTGQKVEVRNYEGDLIRKVAPVIADELVKLGIADRMKYSVRIKLGIRWLTARFDRPSGPPDLDQMRRRDPVRYAALWQGTKSDCTGKGALGRSGVDRSVPFPGLETR